LLAGVNEFSISIIKIFRHHLRVIAAGETPFVGFQDRGQIHLINHVNENQTMWFSASSSSRLGVRREG